MKRAPTWLALSGVGVVLIALCLCDWVMGWWSKLPDETESDGLTPHGSVPAAAAVVPPSPAAPAPPIVAEAPSIAPPAPPPIMPELRLSPQFVVSPSAPPPVVASGPQIVAPPGAVPAYILENAQSTTQLVRGFTRGAWVVFGFYPDGSIRMVDLDGGKYAGHASSARANMKEAGGARSFEVALGVAPDGRLQATFAGGIHDGQTIVLDTIAEKPVA